MKFKELAIISFVFLIVSLAAVSASDLNQTTISDSSSDGSLIVGSVTDSSSDGSLAVDIPVTDSNDHSTVKNSDSNDNSIVDDSTDHSSIIDDYSIDDNDDGTAIDTDDSSIDDSTIDNNPVDDSPIDNIPIDSDITDGDSINGDITPDDSIISNMTNNTPVYNFDDSPIILTADPGSFQSLQSLIDQLPAGSVLLLSRNYKATVDFQIDINKDIYIYGDGHTIDCNGLCRAFDSTAGNIVLKDLKIINGYCNSYVSDDKTNNGGAIWIGSKAKYRIENCNFTNCWADDMGGAIYNEGLNELTITGCLFDGNTCDDVDGGAIYSIPPVHIENSTFKNNFAYKSGGAISIGTYQKRDILSYIINCVFDSNEAKKDKGGAISCWDHLFIDNCRFNSNKGDTDARGGAIYCSGKLIVESSNFTNNFAGYHGGAISSGSDTSINKCIFDSNKVDGQIVHDSEGAAIDCLGYNLYVNNSTFKNNWADDRGGAISAYRNVYINWNQADDEDYNTFFISNTADDCNGGAILTYGSVFIKNAKFISNSANTDGGAIYIWDGCEITHCLFDNNKCAGASSKCGGGAIYTRSSIKSILDCIFTNNYAENYGGAIYSEETVYIYNSTFSHNTAETHGGAIYGKNVYVNQNRFSPQSIFNCNVAKSDNGGAIYATGDVRVFNALFSSNDALVDGGAIFSKGNVDVVQCTFDSNHAMEAKSTPCYGGAIRGGIVYACNSVFKDNYAENHGGAIYADYISGLQYVSFIDNHARKDGGAIYINKGCTIDISQCTFINNLAGSEGGAIYLDSTDSKLSLKNNLFCYNEANEGQAVYNKGEYGDIVNNWWGNKNPSKSNDVLIEWKFWTSNEHHVDVSPLKLALRFSSDIVKVGDIVRATLYFVTSDGAIFTGEMPVDDIGFILPDGFEKVSNNFTMCSAFIEFKPNKAGLFTIKSDLFWQYTNATLHVIDTDPLNITPSVGSFLNAQTCMVGSKNTDFNMDDIVGAFGNKIIADSINRLNAVSCNQLSNSGTGLNAVSCNQLSDSGNGLNAVSCNQLSDSGNGLRLDCNGLKTVNFKNQLNSWNQFSDNYLAHLTADFLNYRFDADLNNLGLKSVLNPTDLEGACFDINSAFLSILSFFGF